MIGVGQRDEEFLFLEIDRHVEEGTNIITHGWKGYRIGDHGMARKPNGFSYRYVATRCIGSLDDQTAN